MVAGILSSSPCNTKLEMYRKKAHKELDKFVDSLAPELLAEKLLTLKEISDAFQEKKPDFLGGLLQDFVQVHHHESYEKKICDCPRCSKQVRKKRNSSRRVETRQGSSLLDRPYFYCVDCGLGFSPFDEALELASRRKQYDLQQLALEYLAEMPFERASELFEKSTGVSFSDHILHDLFEEFSESLTLDDVIPAAEEIERRIDNLSTSGNRRPIMIAATDGAHMPTRPHAKRNEKRGPGEYKEAKGFRLYALGKDDMVQIASWHQIQDADQCAIDLRKVAQRIPTDKVRIALIGDGAPWLWRCMKEAFPAGREILDFYHCAEHIHDLAKVQFEDYSFKALLWIESTMARLFHHEVGYVISDLEQMKPRNEDAKEQIRKLINYLDNNKERIHYHGDRIGGYPIGSGGIESANKFICHTRLKRSGAWWLKINGNGMLGLRCSIVNGTFENAFEKYVSQDQAKRFLRTNA